MRNVAFRSLRLGLRDRGSLKIKCTIELPAHANIKGIIVITIVVDSH